ncbi:hypothetical protein PPYR_07872 [Photinus pyralis]|uniref:Uncharacterized protein n=1 Tax=Photinus pyralis TaxID=7054 RepID=A0A5N4ARL2_PHOPY|nr:uncharacterized protein LOC116167707 [Photinus pyralis]KAB0799992.1 hypothetical protein PPYR_07872 [Photinus pyralis]
MEFGTLIFIAVVSIGVPQAQALRPSTIDIKALELLYREGLHETNELIRQARIPIENIIATGKLNVSQQIRDSQARVASSSGPNSECAKVHAATLQQRVNPEHLNDCDYNYSLNDALNKWDAVKSHIFFCSISSTNGCVDETKKEIKDLKASNAKRIPDTVKLSDSCKQAHCENVVRIIAKIDAAFQNCLHV